MLTNGSPFGPGGMALANGGTGGQGMFPGGFGGGGAGSEFGSGGGGGYNGGGGSGGSNVPGGGGGSFSAATPTIALSGVQTGNGVVTITWTAPCTPPTITSMTASPNTLWPANGQMAPVMLSTTVINGCGAVSCKIISVSSSEPIDDGGDWVITADLTLTLRASRTAKRVATANGRVYTIAVQCKDASNNTTTKTTTVLVPHDQGH